MSRIYAAGAAMGWAVEQVDRTSMWKFWAAWHGFVNANSQAPPGKLSDTEKDALWADIEALDVPLGPLTTQTYLWDGGFVAQGCVVIPSSRWHL